MPGTLATQQLVRFAEFCLCVVQFRESSCGSLLDRFTCLSDRTLDAEKYKLRNLNVGAFKLRYYSPNQPSWPDNNCNQNRK